MGRSPLAPITLEEALSDEGFLLTTKRERIIIQSVDEALIDVCHGRSEKYEAIICSIAEMISSEEDTL
jgi:hypothetical protein